MIAWLKGWVYRRKNPVSITGIVWKVIVVILALAACTLNTSEPDAAPTATPLIDHASDEAPLTVVWTASGELFTWRSRDPFPRRIASGGVIRPLLAPDSSQVAYVRGPGGDPRALWLSDTLGANERQLVDTATLVPDDTTRRIGQIAWSPDGQTLYFNTSTGTGINTRPADDLWRVDIAGGSTSSSTVENLLSDGTGGSIAISPDGRTLAVTAAGTYAQPGEAITVPGAIALFTPATYSRRVLLEFPPVATASQWRWYPDLRWLPDSSALRAAIPVPDLVYGAGDTALWALPLDSDPVQLGTVDADFFGLPTFSADGAWITYIKRRAEPAQTAITLVLAQSSGAQPTDYAQGAVGSLSNATWIAGSARFTFTNGDAGDLWLGGPGTAPARFPSDDRAAPISVQTLTWADPDTAVFIAPDNGTLALWVALLDIPTAPQPLTGLDAQPTALDAVLPR